MPLGGRSGDELSRHGPRGYPPFTEPTLTANRRPLDCVPLQNHRRTQ
jgi:hypothetical protein